MAEKKLKAQQRAKYEQELIDRAAAGLEFISPMDSEEEQGQGLGQGSGQGFGKMFASMFTPHHQTTKPDLHSLPPPHTTCETSRILYIPELICAICHSVYDPSTAYGHHDVYLYPAKEVCTPTTRKYTHHTSWRKTIAVK